MISKNHLDAYLKAMGERDVASARIRMADDVIIFSPLVPVPFKGREPVADVLSALLSTIDAFEPKMLLRDRADFVAVFTIKLGDHTIDGMDHMHINQAGLVDSMTVAWRPLPSVVAVLAETRTETGRPPMKLVPAD